MNFTKSEEFSIPRLILHRNTYLPITRSFVSVTTTSELMNFSSTFKINTIHLKTNETITYWPSDITKSVSQPTDTIKPLLLLQEVPNEAPWLRTHDQEMVRSSRIRTAKLLCKQRLSQWTVAENTIFLSELGVDIERSA